MHACASSNSLTHFSLVDVWISHSIFPSSCFSYLTLLTLFSGVVGLYYFEIYKYLFIDTIFLKYVLEKMQMQHINEYIDFNFNC